MEISSVFNHKERIIRECGYIEAHGPSFEMGLEWPKKMLTDQVARRSNTDPRMANWIFEADTKHELWKYKLLSIWSKFRGRDYFQMKAGKVDEILNDERVRFLAQGEPLTSKFPQAPTTAVHYHEPERFDGTEITGKFGHIPFITTSLPELISKQDKRSSPQLPAKIAIPEGGSTLKVLINTSPLGFESFQNCEDAFGQSYGVRKVYNAWYNKQNGISSLDLSDWDDLLIERARFDLPGFHINLLD